jgi:hypothetical protein
MPMRQQTEEDEDEPWSRRGSVVEVETILRNDLLSIFGKTGLNKSMKQAHKHVASYFGGKEVMSYPTFNNFMRAQNQARNGIKEEHRKWLQEFVAKYTIAQVTGPQVEGAGPQVESTAVQGDILS